MDLERNFVASFLIMLVLIACGMQRKVLSRNYQAKLQLKFKQPCYVINIKTMNYCLPTVFSICILLEKLTKPREWDAFIYMGCLFVFRSLAVHPPCHHQHQTLSQRQLQLMRVVWALQTCLRSSKHVDCQHLLTQQANGKPTKQTLLEDANQQKQQHHALLMCWAAHQSITNHPRAYIKAPSWWPVKPRCSLAAVLRKALHLFRVMWRWE